MQKKDSDLKEPHKPKMNYWSILAKATGFTPQYCYMVLTGRRSQTSKGGKVIMQKYRELEQLISD